MNDISPELKREWIVRALGIAEFTEKENYQGMHTQEHGMKTVVVDLNVTPIKSYFNVDGKKITEDDEHKTLENVDKMISEAEDGRMPTKIEPDIIVTTTMQGAEPVNPDKPIDPEIKQHIEDTKSLSDDDPAKVTAEMVNTPRDSVPQANTLLDLLQQYVGDDVMQVFGDTGTCKSKFALEVAREAIAAGKKVYYLDTERNLTTEDIDSLNGCEYKYTPVLDEIDKIVQKLPVVDVVILDSIGFPVLTSYARLSMKQKGDALLKLIAIFGDLKIWAYRNNGVAVVTNQPESEFGKEKGHIFRPFGDKSQFACKEIWKTEFEHRSPTETRVSIKSFRSRSMGQRSKIASLKITDAGVEVIT